MIEEQAGILHMADNTVENATRHWHSSAVLPGNESRFAHYTLIETTRNS